MREKGLSIDRRDFLARLVTWFSSVFALLTLAAGISLWPAQTRRKDLRLIAVMDEDDIPKAGVRRIDFTVTVDEKAVANRVYLTVIDGRPTFFSPGLHPSRVLRDLGQQQEGVSLSLPRRQI
ncbi:MAG: hypothetical protein MZV70_13535 [Desulfobacterales bacterium]|nr:hypothetical protein [Desulfobacterales bacterium]